MFNIYTSMWTHTYVHLYIYWYRYIVGGSSSILCKDFSPGTDVKDDFLWIGKGFDLIIKLKKN